MADIAKARVPVEFDKAQIAKDADDAIGTALQQAASNGAKLVAGVFASKQLLDVGKQGFDELISSQTVAAQTSVALRSETNITAADIDNLGQSMLDLAGFDDEAARSAANVLLRFGAIHDAGTLKRVETDAADLAKTMGTDLPSAAQTLGQILQDPENAARKLRPIIGSLTDAQKESIKAFTDQGDAAGAQGVILGVLEQRIGGAAKAYGDTLGGSLDKAKENLTNAKASLVEGLAPALETGAGLVSRFAQGVEELPGPLRTVTSLAVGAGVGIVGLAQPIAGLVGSFNSLKTARLLSAAATDADTLAEVENTTAKEANTLVTSGLATKLGLVGVALATGVALWEGYNNAESVNVNVTKAASASTDSLLKAYTSTRDLLGKGGGTEFLDQLAAGGDAGAGAIKRMRDEVAATGGDVAPFDAALAEAKTAQDTLNTSIAAGQDALGGVAGSASNAAAGLSNLGSTPGLLDQVNAAGQLTAKLDEVASKAANIGGELLKLAPADIRAQRGDITVAQDKQAVADAQQKLNDAIAAGDPFAAAKAASDLESANLNLKQATLDLADAQSDLTIAQETAADGLDHSAEKSRLYRDDLATAADSLTGPVHDALVGYVTDIDQATLHLIILQNEQQTVIGTAAQFRQFEEQTSGNLSPSPPPSKARASGGLVGGGERFRGAELGPEVALLANPGTYQLPRPAQILDAAASKSLFGGKGGTTIDIGGVTIIGDVGRNPIDKLTRELQVAGHLAVAV